MFSSLITFSSIASLALAKADTSLPDELYWFHRDLNLKANEIIDSAKLEAHKASILNAIYKTRNYPLNKITEKYVETSPSLSLLIEKIYSSPQYDQCRELYPEHLSGHFHDEISLYTLKVFSTLNNKSAMFPFSPFANIFIDLLISIKKNIHTSGKVIELTDVKKISIVLARIERLVDAIYMDLQQESLDVNQKLDALRIQCAEFNTLTSQVLAKADNKDSHTYVNAYNLKNYFASIAQVVRSLVEVYVGEPSDVKYNEASKSIFELFKSILIVYTKKTALRDFIQNYTGVKVSALANFFVAITKSPSISSTDVLELQETNEPYYFDKFTEQAQSDIQAEEAKTETVEEDQIAIPVIENPLVLDEPVEAKQPEKVASDVVVQPTKKDSSDIIFSYLIPIALFITLIALSLVIFKVFIKGSRE